MSDSGNAWNNAVVLGHESYRDGYAGSISQQEAETLRAAKGHTEMAIRMMQDGRTGENGLIMTQNLNDDIINYISGSDAFSRYVADNYDSSADYWKLMDDGSLKLEDDVADMCGWLRNEDGSFILDENGDRIGAAGIQTGLDRILEYLGISDKTSYQLMENAGMQYYNLDTWKQAGNAGLTINLGHEASIELLAQQQYSLLFTDSLYTTGNLDSMISKIPEIGCEIGYKTRAYISSPLVSPSGLSELIRDNEVYSRLLNKLGKAEAINKSIKEYDYLAHNEEVIQSVSKLIENGVGYGYDGQVKDTNGVVTSASTTMDCIGLISYANKTPNNYRVNEFDLNKYFFPISPDIAREGDVYAYIAYTMEDGILKNNDHVIQYVGYVNGMPGPQIVESTSTEGVRFKDDGHLETYYEKLGYVYVKKVFRYRTW